MNPYLVSILVVLVLPAIHAQCGDQCDVVNQARSVLFNGISSLPKKGFWRRLITFKPTAQVVLVGNTLEDGLMAVATHGNGRILVSGQDRHIENFGSVESITDIDNFHINLKTWLRNGQTGKWKIANPSISSELDTYLTTAKYKTIVSDGGYWATDSDVAALDTWIQSGGTFVLGFDRGEFYASTAESAKHINFYQIALAAGIAIEEDGASVVNPIQTSVSDVSALVDLNLHNVKDALTWANFDTNARLNYILDKVQDSGRFFPHEVSSTVLSVFEPFAYAMESNMIWPEVVAPDDSDKVAVTDKDHAMYNLYYTLSTAHLWRDKAPNVDKFPRDVANPPQTESETFTFQSRKHRYFFSTDYYLVAGQEMTITINNAPGDDTWTDFELYCGVSTDNLLYKRYEIARIPIVARKMNLVDRQTTFKWPFGGLLYFKGPEGTGSTLSITITGVIPSPYLDISNDQDFNATWASRCLAKGLTADVRGYYVRFTLPTDGGVCDMSGEEVKEIVEQWDKIVRKVEELNGADFGTPVDEFRQESFTFDIQTSLGALHSGFPISAKLAYGYNGSGLFYLNGDYTTMWGPYHELGHNYDSKYYVYSGVGESTPNIVSYFCMERMTTQDWYNMTKIQNALSKNALTNWLANPSFTSNYYDNWNRFLVYSQTIRDFGWSCVRDVLKSYFDDENQGNPLPVNDDDEINEWVKRWSLIVGYNLAPLYGNFWKWPLSQDTLDAIDQLPPYLPDDSITQLSAASALTASVVNAWPGLERTVNVTALNCTYFDIEPYI